MSPETPPEFFKTPGEEKSIPGLKILGKIDLSAYEQKKPEPFHPEFYLGSLQARLRAMSERPGYKGFINSDARIIMTGQEADFDSKNLLLKEKAWAGEAGLDYETWLIKREENPSNLTEIGLTLLFDRILGSKFATLRAADYDDYENGADNIIIDRATGAVICGIDDVISRDGAADSKKKEEKIGRKMQSGGAKIKYGATIVDGELVPNTLNNVPLFYFCLSNSELSSLLRSVTDNETPSPVEQKIYEKLITSLADQQAKFTADKSLAPKLQANLSGFAPSLEKMKAEIKS